MRTSPASRSNNRCAQEPLQHRRVLHGSTDDPALSHPGQNRGGLWIYYTHVTLGNPPIQYSVQFDTGSNLMWVRCSPCTDCSMSGQLDAPLYSPSNSSTSSNISCSDDICKDALKTGHSICQASDTTSNRCGYWQAYAGETTTEGYYVSDIMRFDTIMENKNESSTVPSASVIFGCSSSLSGHVQTDGFMGFGKDAPSVILQLSSQGVSPKAFSHCLTSLDDGGGIVVLGEVVEPGFVFTPLVQSQPRYNLNMKSIAVNGQKVPINSSFGSRCFICSKSNVSSFPNVTLYFEGGAPMTVRPESYLLLKGGSARHHNEVILCIGFLRSKEIEGYEHTTVLGDLILRDKVFVYDLEKTRIGWVNYNCSLLSKSSVVVATGSSRRHTPSYCSGLVGIVVVAIIHSNIIALWRLDSY
ncbi:hypothetical protein ZWY2020_019240 [Hordeum vulgare]|nr:hypothetical protein ZWY2020_019240 [Hordeum vulgare]